MNNVADKILTNIEKNESEQIRFGIFDVLLSGVDILSAFNEIPEKEIRAALQQLWQEGEIVRFEDEGDIRNWVFRSRIAETTRIISKLRQRLVGSVKDQTKHRADTSPRLVHDLKFEIAPRLVPERNISIDDFLKIEIKDNRLAQAISILRKIYPPESYNFSGFQQRAFNLILDQILLSLQRKNIGSLGIAVIYPYMVVAANKR